MEEPLCAGATPQIVCGVLQVEEGSSPATCEAVATLLFQGALLESGFILAEPVSFVDRMQPLLDFGLSGRYADQQPQRGRR